MCYGSPRRYSPRDDGINQRFLNPCPHEAPIKIGGMHLVASGADSNNRAMNRAPTHVGGQFHV